MSCWNRSAVLPGIARTNRSTLLRTICGLLLLQFFAVAHAVTPESGIYWAPSRPANLYVIENQRGKIAFIAYTYDEQGRAEWFTSSGTLVRVPPDVEHGPDGWRLDAPLSRATGGPPIGTPGRMPGDPLPYPTIAPIGRVLLTFYAESQVDLEIRINGQTIVDTLEPFNFGYGSIGQSDQIPWEHCWKNYSGEWVFVDRTEPTRPAWRFRFAEPQVRVWDDAGQPTNAAMKCGDTRQAHLVTYDDLDSDAHLRCSSQNVATRPPEVPANAQGCELVSADGTTLFSFFMYGYEDQLKRIRAWLGAPRLMPWTEDDNGTDTPPITGYRVE